MLYQPKKIPIGDFVAVTAERHLAFVPAQSDATVLAAALDEAKRTFDTCDATGLSFRADKTTLSVTVVPTASCNLRCTYCYSDGGDIAADLDRGYAFGVLDSLVARFPQARNINLFFAGGGEPLLRMDIMASVVRHVREGVIGVKSPFAS